MNMALLRVIVVEVAKGLLVVAGVGLVIALATYAGRLGAEAARAQKQRTLALSPVPVHVHTNWVTEESESNEATWFIPSDMLTCAVAAVEYDLSSMAGVPVAMEADQLPYKLVLYSSVGSCETNDLIAVQTNSLSVVKEEVKEGGL